MASISPSTSSDFFQPFNQGIPVFCRKNGQPVALYGNKLNRLQRLNTGHRTDSFVIPKPTSGLLNSVYPIWTKYATQPHDH